MHAQIVEMSFHTLSVKVFWGAVRGDTGIACVLCAAGVSFFICSLAIMIITIVHVLDARLVKEIAVQVLFSLICCTASKSNQFCNVFEMA